MSIAETLSADPSGDVAIKVFEDRVMDYAMDEGRAEAWHLLDWTLNFFKYNPDYEDEYRPPLSYEDAISRALKALRDKDVAAAIDLLERAKRSPRGKGQPSKAEVPAVKAFIYQTYLGWEWQKLAKCFYPCNHNPKPCKRCRESLRKTVGRLRRQLKRYQIEFPPE